MLAAATVLAEPAAYQSFDGPDSKWQLLDPRPGVQIQAHGCVADDAREGTGSERITAIVPPGESAHFACFVPHIPVLDEAEVRLWVKSDRPGVILGARVVLPRSLDPATHRPKTLFVQGSQYDQADGWQQLSLSGLPKQLAARVRVLRTAPGSNIDPHEAYLDAVTLIFPGGPGPATVWTDELVIDGVVASAAEDTTPASDPTAVQTAYVTGSNPAAHVPLAQVQDTTLFVAGKPFLPRAIQSNGEPLAYLAERGFNTIWIDGPPTADQTAEAQRADVWFIATPPRPDQLAADGLGRSLDHVLAWHLGTPGERETDYFRRWAELVRQKDPASHRPILIAPQNDWLPLSKVADVLLATRPDAHALAETDFAQWLDERATLARPGTPLWVTVPTQPSQLVCDQIKALVPHSQLPLIDERQIESLTRSAGIHGCRGFLYESTTPLNANDDVSRRRALALEFQNRQLQLLEPWLTLGKQVSRVTSTDASATATILQVERTRLLVLDPHAGDAQSTAKPPAASRPINATFIVPGVPDSNQVFLLSAAHLEPLSSKRVAGGMQITVDRTAGDMVLLTEDSNVISNFRERLSREGPKAARLERDLLAARVRAGTAEVQRFPQLSVDGAEYLRAIGAANAQIARSDALLNSGNFSESFRTASTAYLSLTQWADYEQQKLAPAAPLASSPIAGCSDNIAEQLEFQKMLSSLRPGDNQLSGGDFEELTQLMQFGWQHVSQPLPGIVPKAELSAVSPHSGRYCLQLSAIAVPPAAAPQIIARPLVRITSPPVHVASGDILVITGYVRIPKPIAGNLDGLTVVDTLGGPELALNIRQSPDWQYFRLIRAAGESSDETVSFLLNGLGNVSIDDVAIHVLSPPSARRLPATAGGLQLVDPHAAGRSLPVSTTSRPR